MDKTPAAGAARPKRPTGIGYLIGRLDHLLSRRMRDCLAPLGATLAQYTALSFLDANPHMSNAQLAERSLVSPQSANEMVKSMQARGWIERAPDPAHGRIVRIRLTRPGRELLRRCDVAVHRMEQAMLRTLDEGERADLQRRLRGLLRELSATLADPGAD